MTKGSGLGDNLYVAGKDLSGDVGSLSAISNRRATLSTTGIDKSAEEKMHGLADGNINFNCFFNPAADQEHETLKAPSASDIIVSYFRGTTLGNPAAGCIGKQANYDWSRAADGGFLGDIDVQSNGYGLEWGVMGTAGKRTDTGATSGTGVDAGTQAAAVTISTSSIADPTVITTATDHGLTTGDKIIIAGHTSCTPDINGFQTVLEVLTTTTFTIDVNVTDDGVDGTCTLISTRRGLSAYLQVFAFTGTSITVSLEESSDNADTDAYAAVTGGAFTAVDADPASERIQTAPDLVVERWVRVVSAGTFNPCTFAVLFSRTPARS